MLEMYRGRRGGTRPASSPVSPACASSCGALDPPRTWYGKPIVALFVCHSGSPFADAERVLAPIKAFGSPPVGDIVQPRLYVSQQTLLDATQPKGRRYYWKSENILPKPSRRSGHRPRRSRTRRG